MENTLYFESITAQRAMLLSEDEALEGATTLSLETQNDSSEQDILTYIEENLPSFFRILRFLSLEDQDLIFSYYFLSKTQTTLAIIHRTTQTLCSFFIRKAVERIGTFIMLGVPTQEVMRGILLKADLENEMKNLDGEVVPLSAAISLYCRTRSFQQVAAHYNVHRPEVRRRLRNAAKSLVNANDPSQKALGAYVHGLVEKASATGSGLTNRKMMKQSHLIKYDPEILGRFQINISDRDFSSLFTSRANR